jgi:drug/metabolite transporter (DMT)-like permease
MSWFFIALIGPVLYALANHTDKYLISRYLKGGAVGSMVIFSALFNIIAIPIILVIHPDVLSIGAYSATVLTLNGMLIVVNVLCYFYALHKDEASYVVPFYQTIPIFGFFLGYFILGETISTTQTWGALIIILGAAVLSFEFEEQIRFKHEVVLLMLTASALYALNGAVFKLIALEGGFWASLFWAQVGQVLIGLMFLLFISSYRRQFLAMLRENKLPVLGLNTLSETMFVVAEAAMAYATLLAPLVLVQLVNSFQPLFVFLIGVFVAVFFPKISHESIARHHLLQKGIGVLAIVVGTYFIGTLP